MKFYTNFNASGAMENYVGDYSELTDIEALPNHCVTAIDESIVVGGYTIEEMNGKGFVSVKHIVETIKDEVREAEKWREHARANDYVKALLKRHKTTIHRVLQAIQILISGGRMYPQHHNAVAAIEENRDTGLKDWCCFLDYDATQGAY